MKFIKNNWQIDIPIKPNNIPPNSCSQLYSITMQTIEDFLCIKYWHKFARAATVPDA